MDPRLTIKDISTPTDKMLPIYNFRYLFTTVFPTKEEWLEGNVQFQADEVVCYTDGSKTDVGTGCGIYVEIINSPGIIPSTLPLKKVSVSMEDHVTMFQAEVYAIGAAARLLIEQGCTGRTISIASDSQSALNAIKNCIINSKVVLETVYYLNQLGEENAVNLLKVPAHTGIDGNEAADRLAKRGADPNFVDHSEVCVGISRNIAKSAIIKRFADTNDRYWNSLSGLEHSKKFINGFTKDKSKKILKMSRHKTRLLTGFLTDHHPLKARLRLMNITEDGTCRFCHIEEEKAQHILCDCQALARTRLRMLGLGFPNNEDYKNIDINRLYEFLSEIKV